MPSKILVILDSQSNYDNLMEYLAELRETEPTVKLVFLCEYDDTLKERLKSTDDFRIYFYPNRIEAEWNTLSANKSNDFISAILNHTVINDILRIRFYQANKIVRWLLFSETNYYYNIYLKINEICKQEDIDCIADFSNDPYRVSEIYCKYEGHQSRVAAKKGNFCRETLTNHLLLRFIRDLLLCIHSFIGSRDYRHKFNNKRSDLLLFISSLTHALDALPVMMQLEKKNIGSCVVLHGYQAHQILSVALGEQEINRLMQNSAGAVHNHMCIKDILNLFAYCLKLLKKRHVLAVLIGSHVDIPKNSLNHIASIFLKHAYEAAKYCMLWDNIMKKLQPRCVLVFNNLMLHERALIVAARTKGKPVVQVTHGIVEKSTILNDDIFPDFILTSYRQLSELFAASGTKLPTIRNIGQPRFDRLFRIKGSVFLPDQKEKLGFSGEYPVFLIISDRLIDKVYLTAMVSVLKRLTNEYPRIQIIWKFHPEIRTRLLDSHKGWFVPKLDFIQKKMVLTNEYTIADLLLCSDLVIMHYLSTSILESIICDKPVIFYDRNNTFGWSFHDFSEVVFTVQNEAECEDAILKALATPSAKTLFPGVTEFMNNYTGVDALAGSRAAEEIELILAGKDSNPAKTSNSAVRLPQFTRDSSTPPQK